MQPENQDVRPPDPDSRWERYSLAKLHTRGECGREVFFEAGDSGKDIEQRNQPRHSNNRLYGTEGISPTLNTAQGGNRQPFIDLSTTEARRTENCRALQARYAKGYSHRKAEVSGIIEIKRQPLRYLNRNQKNIEGDYAFTIDASQTSGIREGARIRKLTPIECERLMSWPDNWTRYGIDERDNKIEISDTQRYKMCGNGVVSKVIENLISKIINK